MIVRAVQFLTVTLFDQYWKKNVDLAEPVFNDDLFKLIVYCMVKPSFVGFDVSDMKVLKQLPDVVNQKSSRF